MNHKPYFGGTGISLEKLIEIVGTTNIDGTTYKIENWIKELEVIDNLIVGKSKVWVPYGNAEFYGTLKDVVWDKHEFKHYIDKTGKLNGYPIECLDWWYYEPYMLVEDINGPESEGYYVYEYSFYKNIKHKVRTALAHKAEKPKRKFLSTEDITGLKHEEIVNNSVKKRQK